MGKVIDLADFRQRPPSWGATVAIDPDGAELVGFWGDDGLEPDERCMAFAERLEALAAQLRQTGLALQEQDK